MAPVLAIVIGSTLTLPPGGTFIDDDGNTHEGMIEAIVAEGITVGCDLQGPRYCPSHTVTRAQMASFIARALAYPPGADRFTDDNGSVHEDAINALAQAGVTVGCSVAEPHRYCPEAPVKRGQMAAFLQRALDLATPQGPDTYTDDDGTTFEPAIEAIAAAGITAGCDQNDPTRFCPAEPVRRDQMATFLGRAMNLTPLAPPPRLAPMDRMITDVAALVDFGPRVAGTAAERAAAAWIVEQFTAITGAAHTEDVPLPNGLTTLNVWTAIGTGEIELLIGGHYDSVSGSPGADDNASGIAVILELARTLALQPPDDMTVTLVGFGAEEVLAGYGSDAHHFGSRHMADRMAATDSLPDLMVAVDMVGVGGDLWAVTYLDQLPTAAELLVRAGARAGVEVTQVSRGDISDHEGFVRAGVSAAFLWRPDNPAWHTSSDSVVRAEALAEDLAVMVAWLDEVRANVAPGGIN